MWFDSDLFTELVSRLAYLGLNKKFEPPTLAILQTNKYTSLYDTRHNHSTGFPS